MKQASVAKSEKPSEDVWTLLGELQKDPEFVRAVREFIKRTTS